MNEAVNEPRQLDPEEAVAAELDAMRVANEALSALDYDGRRRAVSWLCARLGLWGMFNRE